MKILVSITNYGTKNVEYAKQLIQEYRSMPFDTDIFVLSEAPKDFGADVTVLTGLPSKDPWSLPFGHKKLFADNLENYDLFIYTEDDMLMREANILAFLKASEQLGAGLLPGFVQYEQYLDGKKNYPQMHGPYHWLPGSVRKSGEYLFAECSNAHSACYILTQKQLRKALASGGFLVSPHSGRYDLLCSAATDPYTQCGFERVLCISHLKDFELHHLPNRYLDLVGLDEDRFQLQIEALQEIYYKNRSNLELFNTEKPLATQAWDKSYYEPCRDDIVRLISSDAKEILSIGCGWGLTESYLIECGKWVAAIPLDSVIGKLAEERGVNILNPDFEQAFEMLGGKKFDAIILSDVLQHLKNPIDVLIKLRNYLDKDGVLIGSIPNLSPIRRLSGQLLLKNKKWSGLDGSFIKSNLNFTNVSMIKEWFKVGGFRITELRYENHAKVTLLPSLGQYLPSVLTASNIVFISERLK